MITPEELYEKALRLYPKAIDAWLTGDEANFFPHTFRVNLRLSSDYDEAKKATQLLRAGSKASIGCGYSLDSETSALRKHGRQERITRVFIESMKDLLVWVDKQSEFRRLDRSIQRIREQSLPLVQWSIRNWRRLIEVESNLNDLLAVVNYLCKYPRPNCFPRELPIPVSTKLIEEHPKLLAEWLDIVLPETAIHYDFGRDRFAARYGFRERREHFLIRLLDDCFEKELNCPGSELSLPLDTIAALPAQNAIAVIVENKTNLLTLPMMERGIAVGGLGHGVAQLFEVAWLEKSAIVYWGDLDTDGFLILAALRRRFSQVQSMMMDRNTLEIFASLITSGNRSNPDIPEELYEFEREAFILCRENNWRLEQEHIPQRHVIEQMRRSRGASSVDVPKCH